MHSIPLIGLRAPHRIAMLIAIDVGNSHTTFGVFRGAALVARWRLASDAQRTLDEWRLLVGELLALRGVARTALTGAAACCVVPALLPIVEALCRDLTGHAPLIVGPGTTTGIDVRYRPPTDLGSDRLVDAVAASDRFGAPVVVVDLGTATTFNVVDGDHHFIGGAVAAGVGTGADALVEAGARLRAFDLVDGPTPRIGRTTEQALRAGIVHGHAGLVAGILRRIEAEMASEGIARPTVVATGGWSARIVPLVPRIDHHLPDLILDGLRVVWSRRNPSAAA